MENLNMSFEESVAVSNSKRILIIGGIYTIFEIIGLTLSTLGFFSSDIRLYVAIVVALHLIILPLIYHWTYGKTMDARIVSRLQFIYFAVIIAWGSTFTALMYLVHEDITIYVIVIMLCASVFTVDVKFSKILFIGAMVFFGGLIYLNSSSVLVANGLFFKSLIVTIIGYIISSSAYNNRRELHITNEKLIAVNEQLKDQVIRDSLTGLYNNSYIFDYIDLEIEKTKRYEKAMSLIMLDIDDFKLVNDRFGHLEGDKVIQAVADILRKETRDFDLPARYGGEEFLVVLINSDLDNAKLVAERIRLAVENLKFSFNQRVTVSLGVAQWDKDTRTSLIKKADDQLYQAKALGKNKVS